MNEPIGTISGQWWLLQMWLNLHMHRVAVKPQNFELSVSELFRSPREKSKSRRQILPMSIFWRGSISNFDQLERWPVLQRFLQRASR
jgi:hypothetical protein